MDGYGKRFLNDLNTLLLKYDASVEVQDLESLPRIIFNTPEGRIIFGPLIESSFLEKMIASD